MSTPEKNVTPIKILTISDVYMTLDCMDRNENFYAGLSKAYCELKKLGEYEVQAINEERDTRKSGELVIWAIQNFALSGSEVNRIKIWVREQLMDSPNYLEYTLNETFCNNNDKNKKQWHMSNPPGKIRIFSKERMCYFDGKNWKKVKV